MKHRHLDIAPGTAVEALPDVALVDLLDRGDLDDWKPIVKAVARDPLGAFAERVMRLVDRFPMYGTSPLLRAWIDRVRAGATAPDSSREVRHRDPQLPLPALRRGMGLTQARVAARMGMSQSDLSKFERRRDVRLSTLRAYVEALGGRLRVLAVLPESHSEIRS